MSYLNRNSILLSYYNKEVLVKQINTIFNNLKTILLSFSYFSSYSKISFQILLILCLAKSFTTYTIQSSIKAIDLLFLILYYIRLVLKKRNRISARGNPYSNPIYSKFFTLDINLLTIIYAFLLVQKSYTYLTIGSRILLYLSYYNSSSVIILLQASLILKKTNKRVFLSLYILKIDSYKYNIVYIIDFYFQALKQLFSSNLQTLVR